MIELSTYEVGILAVGAIVAGIWMLVKGGDWTIDAAVAIAQRAKLSPMFIGATIVAFGTSLPELFTSINANQTGFPGISLGNIVGSNIANILLVMGAAALIFTLSVDRREVMKDLAIMLVATAILVAGMLFGIFERWMGIAMVALLAGFVLWQYLNRAIDTSEVEEEHDMTASRATLVLGAGFLALAIGSEMLVRGAVVAGGVIGVPEAIIGMTAVALGTSLPELTASIAAAAKRETSLMFGNIIGSNTFNILWIVGFTAAVKPLAVDSTLLGVELSFMVLVSIGFAAMLAFSISITRAIGFGFLAAYIAFTLYQFRGVVL